MKSKLTLWLAAFLFSGLSLFAQDYSESELQSMFMSYLENEGITGWVDSDGDVQFKYNDHNYYIGVPGSDQEFIRVVLFNFWEVESNTEAIQVAFACDAVNREMKVAKAYTTSNDKVQIACELFLRRPQHLEPILKRCIDSIESSIDKFVEEM